MDFAYGDFEGETVSTVNLVSAIITAQAPIECITINLTSTLCLHSTSWAEMLLRPAEACGVYTATESVTFLNV